MKKLDEIRTKRRDLNSITGKEELGRDDIQLPPLISDNYINSKTIEHDEPIIKKNNSSLKMAASPIIKDHKGLANNRYSNFMSITVQDQEQNNSHYTNNMEAKKKSQFINKPSPYRIRSGAYNHFK